MVVTDEPECDGEAQVHEAGHYQVYDQHFQVYPLFKQLFLLEEGHHLCLYVWFVPLLEKLVVSVFAIVIGLDVGVEVVGEHIDDVIHPNYPNVYQL